MKTKLLVAASILAFATAAQALPPKPAKCPGAAAINSVGLSKDVVAQDKDGLWVVGVMKNKYDTKDAWTFVVGRIDAKDAKDAFKKASATLPTLKFQQGPIAIQQLNKWGCAYSTDAGYVAISVTPQLQGMSLSSVSHSLS
jgi:hypothetical protein